MNEPRQRFSGVEKPTAEPAPEHADPADANNWWEWIESMAKIGFTIAVIEMSFDQKALEEFGPPEVLASQLIAEELGHFDSVLRGNPFRLYFYIFRSKLPAWLQFAKDGLAAASLLPLSKIGYADVPDHCWRVFYPDLGGTGT
jgi:hypothetical protein